MEARWVFGGYCSDQKKGFLQFVDEKDSKTILPLIMDNIAAGSIIHSDGWAAYGGSKVTDLPVDPPYQHFVVNHSEHFVDPESGAHTNHVEVYWRHAKEKLKRMYGCHSSQLASHLDEFMWFQRFGRGGPIATMDFLMEQIADWYPTP